MQNKEPKILDDLMHSDRLVFTFLRSIFSSQVASWLDLLLGFLLFSLVHMSAFWSAAIGAIAGGVLNCIINYRFTFHATGCSWRAVAVKYIMIWVGSVLLNSFGTELVYRMLSDWHLAEELGISDDACYAVARLSVSLAVSLAWNFIMQRVFVYRVTRLDNAFISFANIFIPKGLRQ